MSDDLNNNSVMIPSILNDSKEQSSLTKEFFKKECIRLDTENKEIRAIMNVQGELINKLKSRIFALADQKAKIRDWIIEYFRDYSLDDIRLAKEFDKEFEELK